MSFLDPQGGTGCRTFGKSDWQGPSGIPKPAPVESSLDFHPETAPTPDEKQAAIQAATRACDASDWKGPAKLDALVTAYAEAGDLDAANEHRAAADATRLCALGGWTEPAMLNDLASAGDLAAAAQWQARANDLQADPKARADGEQRLKLYRAGKPDRRAPPSTGGRPLE